MLRQELFGWGSSRRTDDTSTCWACFEKGRLCNVPPKPKNVGKPAIHNNTVSFHVLDTAQDSLVVDNRVFIPQVLLNMYHVFQYINFLKLREDLDLRLCMIFCHAFVPLLCPFVGCRKNFSWRKAMPQTKSVIKGKYCARKYRVILCSWHGSGLLGRRLQGCSFLRICWMIFSQHLP